jgi:putative ABC transport system permease protein
MLSNYLKIAWRNLIKHGTFSFINIFGLATGIASCVLIFLFVFHEFSFDKHNINADRIARVTTILHTPESDISMATSPALLHGALKRQYPEVENATGLENIYSLIKSKNEIFREDAFYGTNASVFSVFSFSFIHGNAKDALKEVNSIVITEKIAKKYFGSTDILGKTLVCNEQQLKVTGVIKNLPASSDLAIDALLFKDFEASPKWAADDFSTYTFVLFKNPQNLAVFQKKIQEIAKKYIQPELNAEGASEYSTSFEVETLADVHFSKGKYIDNPKGNKLFNYIFSMLAAFILVIALLNYINLSTARATERAREVGVRKVNGAQPRQLIKQFLFESSFLILISWVIAAILVALLLPLFNRLLDMNLSIHWKGTTLFAFIAFIITVLLAGLYPAFILSAYKPIEILKGNFKRGTKGIYLRKSLTGFQFVITVVLITGTIVIYSQVKYLENKSLGYEKEGVLKILVPTDSIDISRVSAFKKTLEQHSSIRKISAGGGFNNQAITMASTVAKSGGKTRELMCNFYMIDPSFLPLLEIKLLEGRNITDSLSTDKKEAFLVNEAFVQKMGWKQALGQTISAWGHDGKVVGVVKNFYYESLHKLVAPLVMMYNVRPVAAIMVKTNPENLAMIKQLWTKHFPDRYMNYEFLNDTIALQYKKDKMTMTLFGYFTILAIIISCLGLYGLVALMAVYKTKEIGIRKVLGASLHHLLSLLSREYILMIGIASLIALPLAAIALHQWLREYAYHINLSWWMFVLPVIIILIIAFAVIFRQVLNAALANPVKSLRME